MVKKSKKRQRHEPGASTTASNGDSSRNQSHSTLSAPTNFSGKKFLMPQDGEVFQNLVRTQYQGFVHVPADQVSPSNFHQVAKAAFERLRDSNYFQYDIVKAGGTHASRTFVKRTLVGEPGITYKYLGLRLFAHAWSGPGVLPVMKAIGQLNQHMIQMTKKYPNHGKCDYNLTLINFMEPSSHSKVGFKDEAFYGMGKVSVSWHADSSLQSNSSIGVYHLLPSQRSSKWDWRIGLRRIPDSSSEANTVTPVVASTKDGDAYFLLGNFNETHQHCVLSGSESSRISSTHRVAVTQEDTYEYIRKRAKAAIKRFRMQLDGERSKMDPKVIIYCQRVLTEVEMEWIAQYWLQGAEHDKLHQWWQRPMRTLEVLWSTLEEYTLEFYSLCVDNPDSIPRLAIKGFLLELQHRQELREQWDERRADKIYQRRIQAPFRPVARPSFDQVDSSKSLGKNLKDAIQRLTEIREQQLASKKKGSSDHVPTNGNGKSAMVEGHKKKGKRATKPDSSEKRKKHKVLGKD